MSSKSYPERRLALCKASCWSLLNCGMASLKGTGKWDLATVGNETWQLCRATKSVYRTTWNGFIYVRNQWVSEETGISPSSPDIYGWTLDLPPLEHKYLFLLMYFIIAQILIIHCSEGGLRSSRFHVWAVLQPPQEWQGQAVLALVGLGSLRVWLVLPQMWLEAQLDSPVNQGPSRAVSCLLGSQCLKQWSITGTAHTQTKKLWQELCDQNVSKAEF